MIYSLLKYYLVVTLLIFAGCAKSQEEKALKIEDKNVSIRIEAAVYPSKREDVLASVAGKVKKLYVTYGDRVKKGDILYSLDKELIKLDIQNKKIEVASLEKIRNNFKRNHNASSKEAINLAAQELKKISKLKAQGYVRSFEENTYKKNYINAIYNNKTKDNADYEKLNTLETNLATKKIELKKLEYQLKHADAYAHIDGFIVDIQVDVGESINEDKKVCIIENLDSVIVRAGFANGLLPFIHIGQIAKISFVTSPPYNTEAKVNRIVPIVDPAFKNMTLDIELPNNHYILQEGTRALVTLELTKEGQEKVRKYFMHNKKDRVVEIQSKI